MDEYSIVVTPYAEAQLKEIVDYISVELLNPMAANAFVDRIQEKISKLKEFPEAYPLVGITYWTERGIRKLIVKSFVVYFNVDKAKHNVNVLAVVYGKMDQLKQLNKLDF